MTELEMIERAKMYLDKLANGIDPLTDQPVQESDVVNQVRISRCLFFTSDVLRRIIENGGVNPPKSGKIPFSINGDAMKRIQLSDTPIHLTELRKRITAATGVEKMSQISHSLIVSWLENAGFMEIYFTADEKKRYKPTANGEEIGIFTEDRVGQYGSYTAVMYNKSAQQFIIDNLPNILATKI